MIHNSISREEFVKDEIISTAQKLFRQYGFQKTTMEDIARSTGRGKSTLYYYYKSKDVIFTDVIEKEAREILLAVNNAVNSSQTASEMLQSYFIVTFESIKHKINLYGIMRHELLNTGDISSYKPALSQIKRFIRSEKTIIKNILLSGVNNHEFTQEIIKDIDMVVYVIITAQRAIFIDLTKRETDVESAKIQAMVNILLKGICTS
ncbi:MAG: TetR/AcrR family transcriptional regulator [Paludibacter sp.]|nr:TetR/AcrR family transcriptional regulator [Paludibacter sp.]